MNEVGNFLLIGYHTFIFCGTEVKVGWKVIPCPIVFAYCSLLQVIMSFCQFNERAAGTCGFFAMTLHKIELPGD